MGEKKEEKMGTKNSQPKGNYIRGKNAKLLRH